MASDLLVLGVALFEMFISQVSGFSFVGFNQWVVCVVDVDGQAFWCCSVPGKVFPFDEVGIKDSTHCQ